jgi:hypothetical protein
LIAGPPSVKLNSNDASPPTVAAWNTSLKPVALTSVRLPGRAPEPPPLGVAAPRERFRLVKPVTVAVAGSYAPPPGLN